VSVERNDTWFMETCFFFDNAVVKSEIQIQIRLNPDSSSF